MEKAPAAAAVPPKRSVAAPAAAPPKAVQKKPTAKPAAPPVEVIEISPDVEEILEVKEKKEKKDKAEVINNNKKVTQKEGSPKKKHTFSSALTARSKVKNNKSISGFWVLGFILFNL